MTEAVEKSNRILWRTASVWSLGRHLTDRLCRGTAGSHLHGRRFRRL